ncbi:MAG TPA: response regulator [Candidatus Thermoplasmatota archaeon]|nr:response regulator [Candidatus Thermoplasmatota archaeon]
MIPGLERGDRPGVVSLTMRRVLVVDDALPVRRTLMEILHRVGGVSGAQVQIAQRPDEALELFAKHHPSLVFAELVGAHPGEGLEMVGEMLRLDPKVRVVLVTAEDPSSALVRQAVRMGVFAVVPKPLRHERFRQVFSEIEAEEGGIERFR